MTDIRVGICGLGTVAAGTLEVLRNNQQLLDLRSGRALRVVHVGSRSEKPDVNLDGIRVSRDIFEVARDPEVDVLIELIGGEEPARTLVLEALRAGKHVVTANKALIAKHGNELLRVAEENSVSLLFEAAVAGAIPILRNLREGLSANRISTIAGIINGTGNFILTEMRDHGRAYADVLAEAQALGYAEADPTFDVEGIDTAHKLAILASIAFGIPLSFDAIHTDGIGSLQKTDVEYADKLGYRIKHLGIARRTEQGIELRVHLTLIPESILLAEVDGVMNAVWVEGDASGPTLSFGAGAGAGPTASAVVADLVEVARTSGFAGSAVPPLGVPLAAQQSTNLLPISESVSGHYLRISAANRSGVMQKITSALSAQGVSIESIIQNEKPSKADTTQVVLVTSAISGSAMAHAIAEIEALEEVVAPLTHLRVEQLES